MYKPLIIAACVTLSALCLATPVSAAQVYLRFLINEPAAGEMKATIGGFRHDPPWYLPPQSVVAEGGKWSQWIDLTKLPLHERLNRVGGLVEWPSVSLGLSHKDGNAVRGCALRVQLADKPDDRSVVIDFNERSSSHQICFLVPHPLREKKSEFETGSQMAARHSAWAREATGGQARKLKNFDILSVVFSYDPLLVKQDMDTLKMLGFNVLVVGMQDDWWSVAQQMRRNLGIRTFQSNWHLEADPEESVKKWDAGDGAKFAKELTDPTRRRFYEDFSHHVIWDELMVMDLTKVDPDRLNGWFRDYVRAQGETDASLGVPIETMKHPSKEMMELKSLPRDADLPTRKIMYYAGKFGQYWTVKTLKHTNDLLKKSFSSLSHEMRTETLPSDHNYFNAWGPPTCGMGYRGLDFFEIGAQRAVDMLSAEDWMGLNHMYGPDYTWTGAMSFEFLNAIYRCAIDGTDMSLRSLITPSDDGYLRLKTYSSLAQGSKSFFYWAFGPTYLATENYWADLRSEYNGIAKTTAALEKAEDILFPAKPVRDPVAILYSVSHDLWHTDDPAGLVETRLTFAALRHMSIQPDFLREEDVEAGKLNGYKVLYIIGECLTRKASAAVDEWVKAGGTVYLTAGAATRDEFYEPYLPTFAAAVWPSDACKRMIKETGHAYNERIDLPVIKPLATARLVEFDTSPMKVIGYRLDPKPGISWVLARFDDGKPAAVRWTYGEGRVYACGFLPGLAYSPFKVGQTTLDEEWPAASRELIAMPLAALPPGSRAVQTSKPVVEASLLSGPKGSALVLVNYTYKPVRNLRVLLPSVRNIGQVTSTEGVKVKARQTPEGLDLELPLAWTDIVVMHRK